MDKQEQLDKAVDTMCIACGANDFFDALKNLGDIAKMLGKPVTIDYDPENVELDIMTADREVGIALDPKGNVTPLGG